MSLAYFTAVPTLFAVVCAFVFSHKAQTIEQREGETSKSFIERFWRYHTVSNLMGIVAAFLAVAMIGFAIRGM